MIQKQGTSNTYSELIMQVALGELLPLRLVAFPSGGVMYFYKLIHDKADDYVFGALHLAGQHHYYKIKVNREGDMPFFQYGNERCYLHDYL